MDRQKNKYYYLKGIKNGMPICLGYLAVSFTLGITARNAGMTAWQAMLTSLSCNASSGQYAGFTVIAAGGTYFEMVLMELVANARYLLMSCSLSQKFSSETGLLHRLLVGFDVTDEIFGVAVSEPGKLNPFYNYGMMTVAIPGWSLGTFFGVIMEWAKTHVHSTMHICWGALAGLYYHFGIPTVEYPACQHCKCIERRTVRHVPCHHHSACTQE